VNSAAGVKRLWSNPDMLCIEWSDGTLGEYASIWLRDNLREDRDPHSGQRLIDIGDVPEDPKIRSAAARNGAVAIEWEGEQLTSSFEFPWLLAQAPSRRPEFTRKRWLEGAHLSAARDFAWAAFSAAKNERALRASSLERLLQDGIAFLSDAPANENGILDAAALVGRIAELRPEGFGPAPAGAFRKVGHLRPLRFVEPQVVVRRGITLVPEGRLVFPQMTVMENLQLGAHIKQRAQVAALVDYAFSLFPRLFERRGQLAGSMSGGEQQMLAIARGLMAEPRLIILDEPSLGLMPIVTQEVFRLIEAVEDSDDVQDVYANYSVSDEVIEKLS